MLLVNGRRTAYTYSGTNSQMQLAKGATVVIPRSNCQQSLDFLLFHNLVGSTDVLVSLHHSRGHDATMSTAGETIRLVRKLKNCIQNKTLRSLLMCFGHFNRCFKFLKLSGTLGTYSSDTYL